MEASYLGHADVVKALIEAGADVNLTDEVSHELMFIWVWLNSNIDAICSSLDAHCSFVCIFSYRSLMNMP